MDNQMTRPMLSGVIATPQHLYFPQTPWSQARVLTILDDSKLKSEMCWPWNADYEKSLFCGAVITSRMPN